MVRVAHSFDMSRQPILLLVVDFKTKMIRSSLDFIESIVTQIILIKGTNPIIALYFIVTDIYKVQVTFFGFFVPMPMSII